MNRWENSFAIVISEENNTVRVTADSLLLLKNAHDAQHSPFADRVASVRKFWAQVAG